MLKTLSRLLFLTLFSLTFYVNIYSHLLNAEELIYIQAVSNSKKSFVIRRGKKDNIVIGQRSLFSTDNASVVARAIETNRNHSVWTPSKKELLFPFKRNESVIFTNSIESVWSDISRVDSLLQGIADNKIKKAMLSTTDWKKLGKYPRSFEIKTAYQWGLVDDATSETSGDQPTARMGMGIQVSYSKYFRNGFELGVGLRYDNDSIEIENPSLIIPTSRYIILIDATYHFSHFHNSLNHLYIGVATGYGFTETRVDSDIIVGSVYLLPSVKIGIQIPLKSSFSLLLEAQAESLAQTEQFDYGLRQTTNTTLGKVVVGIKF